MHRLASGLIRIGALLIFLSPLLPQAEAGTSRFSPVGLRGDLAGRKERVEALAVAAGLFLPPVAALALLAGSWGAAARRALQAPFLALLLILCFALATLGSLLLTEPGGSSRAVDPSFSLSLALFLAPLAIAGVALARRLEKGFDAGPGPFEPLAFAVLLGLQGLYLADSGWAALVAWTGVSAPVRLLPGAAVEPLGALLAGAGAVLSRRPPATAAVDTAPASG